MDETAVLRSLGYTLKILIWLLLWLKFSKVVKYLTESIWTVPLWWFMDLKIEMFKCSVECSSLNEINTCYASYSWNIKGRCIIYCTLCMYLHWLYCNRAMHNLKCIVHTLWGKIIIKPRTVHFFCELGICFILKSIPTCSETLFQTKRNHSLLWSPETVARSSLRATRQHRGPLLTSSDREAEPQPAPNQSAQIAAQSHPSCKAKKSPLVFNGLDS